jgi:hypothetical protein
VAVRTQQPPSKFFPIPHSTLRAHLRTRPRNKQQNSLIALPPAFPLARQRDTSRLHGETETCMKLQCPDMRSCKITADVMMGAFPYKGQRSTTDVFSYITRCMLQQGFILFQIPWSCQPRGRSEFRATMMWPDSCHAKCSFYPNMNFHVGYMLFARGPRRSSPSRICTSPISLLSWEHWPPLWSSGQSSWLYTQRFCFDSRCYQIFWDVVDLERGPLSLVSTIGLSSFI